MNIAPPAKYRYDKGIVKDKKYADCTFWNQYTIKRMLKSEVYIGNIAVDENMRRKHIADGLMTKLIDYCEENHSELLTLEVRVSNIPALNLYGKYGFKVAGKRKNFYTKPTEDGYIMTRVFSHA